MRSPVTAVLDACVLYPAPLRDLLMWLALSDLFRARWTSMIHDEWMRNLLANRPDLKHEDLARTRSLMDAHVRDCVVTGFEPLIASIALPDADDRHVVAAAVHSGAQRIITFNLTDFPDEQLQPLGLQAVHPDGFVLDLLNKDPDKVCQAVAMHRRTLKNPPKSGEAYLDTLLKQGLPQTVEGMLSFLPAI
jgi:PIN domain